MPIYYRYKVDVATQRDANTTTQTETFRMKTALLPSKAQTIQTRETTTDIKGEIAVMDIRVEVAGRHCRDRTLLAMAKGHLRLPHYHIPLTKTR
jgi:hypothetical protein